MPKVRKSGRASPVSSGKARSQFRDNEINFILERYDELIERVVIAETRRHDMKQELDFVKSAFMAFSKKPLVVALTDEQLDRMIVGIGKHVAEAMGTKENVN